MEPETRALTFAERLSRMQKAKRYGDIELAGRAGLSDTGIRMIKKRNGATAESLSRLADALGCTMGDLYRGRP